MYFRPEEPYTYGYRGLSAYHGFGYDLKYFIEGQDNLYINYDYYENGGVKTGIELDLFGIWPKRPHTDIFKFIKENL